MNIISNTINYVLQSLFNLTGDWGITINLQTSFAYLSITSPWGEG